MVSHTKSQALAKFLPFPPTDCFLGEDMIFQFGSCMMFTTEKMVPLKVMWNCAVSFKRGETLNPCPLQPLVEMRKCGMKDRDTIATFKLAGAFDTAILSRKGDNRESNERDRKAIPPSGKREDDGQDFKTTSKVTMREGEGIGQWKRHENRFW